ncbi:MAG TPA: FAD-dependent oxidoreductase [Pyrinomonadaceae bacterium]|nr:FAD-dependent oxidoreductase [Pyrinomonadaceae bacterium]
MHGTNRNEKCLSLCQLGSSRRLYSIGPFFKSGLTVFKQQVRALNLIYVINEATKPRNGDLAIIGGGVAGVTAAAAAAALGWKVHLFEQRPVLCHLQHGCDTRWLHPHIYDWPQPGSDDPYAGLPLLNWKEGTAATVTEQIMLEFNEIARGAGDNLKIHLGATTQLAEGNRVKWDNSQENPRGGEREFSHIVLAVGFGIEAGVHEASTPSYWRNDSVNQPRPGITSEKPDLYFVSGTGDGGLIDLLRARISSFNQGRIIDELINADDPHGAELIERLRDIVKSWSGGGTTFERNWLFNKYDDLKKRKLLVELDRKVEKRLRRDTAAILNGRERTFSEVLSLSSASMFNTLLTYILYQLRAFSYVYGDFRRDAPGQVTIGQDAVSPKLARAIAAKKLAPKEKTPVARSVSLTYDHLTIRHGADRKQSLLSVGVDEIEIESLKKQQAKEVAKDTIEPLWPAGWWSLNNRLSDRINEPIEFVPPATLTIASTFVSTLSDILIQLRQVANGVPSKALDLSGRDFRMTLHRLLDIQGKAFFQQVAYYAGTRTEGSPGRVFEVETGLVGLVCRSGAPIRARRKNKKDWARLWKALALKEHGAQPVNTKVQAILACPFFVPSEVGNERHVSLVLFIDSEQVDFFTPKILETVFSASAGFVHTLDERVETGDVRFATRSFRGYKPKLRAGDRQIFDEFKHILQVVDEAEFQQFVDKLTFDKVRSFDAELQLPRLGRQPRAAATLPA